MEYWKENGIMACGAIRSDHKGLPKGMKAERALQRGEFDCRITNESIGFYTWMDNKAAHLISNFHGSAVFSVSGTQKDGFKKEFPCPAAVKHYNDMGGVDKADLWHRIFFGFLDSTFVNAYVV